MGFSELSHPHNWSNLEHHPEKEMEVFWLTNLIRHGSALRCTKAAIEENDTCKCPVCIARVQI